MLRAKLVVSKVISPVLLEFFETPMLKVLATVPWRRYRRVPTCWGCVIDGPEVLLKPAMKAGVAVRARSHLKCE